MSRKYIYFILALFLPLKILADLNDQMNTFFNQFGAVSNTTTAQIYEGQKAGYATGGSVALRGRVMNSKVATINLPKFNAGCGGIDIYAGGMSFISSEELVKNMKAIASNAAGYAFMLGIETMSAQVANNIRQFQTWANNINSIGINSCEIASGLVGSVWPQKSLASQHICETIGSNNNLFRDRIDARHQCSNSGTFDKVMEGGKGNSLFKNILSEEFNIAWEAIQTQSFLTQDSALAEFFMSLMGTVVSKKEKNNISVQILPSKISNESFLKALLEGGKTTGYHCTGIEPYKKCLVVMEKDLEMTIEKSWLGKVQATLVSMQNKILKDEELNETEKQLLTKTSLPLYKIVNAMTAYKKGSCPLDLYQISDIVAMSLLIHYLKESIEIVRQGAEQLKRGQMYADEINEYLIKLKNVEEVVNQYEIRNSKRFEFEFQLIQKIQMIEDQLASEIILN